jgi:riboflavin kinase/FMN adenylyltransferase
VSTVVLCCSQGLNFERCCGKCCITGLYSSLIWLTDEIDVEVIRGIINLRPQPQGCVVTLGNFDGVHRGHQAVLAKVREKSKELGVPSVLVCFEPQPKEFFDEFNAPARLSRFREKIELLSLQGIDTVLCLRFNEATRSMSATEFIGLLVEKLNTKALFVGDDARFGADRSGSYQSLLEAGRKFDFEVMNLRTLTFAETRVSSSRIRECLALGDLEQAEEMLGYPYSIKGKVVYGRQLGRTLNAPTANVQLHRYRAPIDGVFAVEAWLGSEGNEKIIQGVANVGFRPTLNEASLKPILEVFLFDFKGNLYGQSIKVVFRSKLRNEKKFNGLDELKEAIANDIKHAEKFFSDRSKDIATVNSVTKSDQIE